MRKSKKGLEIPTEENLQYIKKDRRKKEIKKTEGK